MEVNRVFFAKCYCQVAFALSHNLTVCLAQIDWEKSDLNARK